MKENEHEIIKNILELSKKWFIITNSYAKVKTWMCLMIRKFNKIRGDPGKKVSKTENLLFYLTEIRKIFSESSKLDPQNLGKLVEARRKSAVNSMITGLSKLPHQIFEEEFFNIHSLESPEHDTDDKIKTHIFFSSN